AKKVERTLAQGVASETPLVSMQHECEKEAEEPLLLIGARGERGMMDGAMQAIQDGDLDPRLLFGLAGGGSPKTMMELLRVPGMTKNIRAALLKYNNRFVELAKLPVEEQVAHIHELQTAGKDLPELARPLFMAPLNVAGAFHRDQANLR